MLNLIQWCASEKVKLLVSMMSELRFWSFDITYILRDFPYIQWVCESDLLKSELQIHGNMQR